MVYTTPDPPPVTGAKILHTPPQFIVKGDETVHCDLFVHSSLPPGALPNFEFPKFDGSNTRMWVKGAKTYFDVYSIEPGLWVKIASMNLTGVASLWFHTLTNPIESMSWKEFVTAASNKFDKDERNHLLQAFFRIRQSTSVNEYIEHFSDILHKLLVHDPNLPTSIITNRFVDGLKKEIRAVVMVHRLQCLDTASSLALLQEEALLDSSTRELKKWDSSKRYSGENFKFNDAPKARAVHPHPKLLTPSPEDKRLHGQARVRPPEDKLSSHKSYRRSKGLCFKCGEKWGLGHKCPPTVSLQVMEEVWQYLVEENPDPSSVGYEEQESDDDELMAVSVQALRGIEGNQTIRFRGYVEGQEVFMLLDAGSSNCFISQQIATGLPG